MGHYEPRGLGWRPSLPDFRDFTPQSKAVQPLLERLRRTGAGSVPPAAEIDLREYFIGVDDQQTLKCSTAHTCVGLVEYFERRAHGHVIRPSRLFLHQNACRFSGAAADADSDYRTTFKAMKCCGVPPEDYWPYDISRLDAQPDAFLYSFVEPYRSTIYVRLDQRNAPGSRNLATLKAFLAAGFPVAFGFPVPSILPDDGNIPYRPTFDSVHGGQALLAVGYDDHWLRGSRGALLVRNSWGPGWGEKGYGWLPYVYVEERLAIEFWTLMRGDWLDSGEFDAPVLPD
jgi:C1A family cysteine protease